MLCDIRPLEIDRWLGEKGKEHASIVAGKLVSKPGLSWNTRTDLRNLMSGVFTKAAEWKLWTGDNPLVDVHVGKKRTVRQYRKLTTEETRLLLDLLPADVRIICEVALYCTLRISEVLGLQWQHIDFQRGLLCIRQRYYRGDVDTVKSEQSERNVPMGVLAEDLAALYPGPGHASDYVFSVRTHINRDKALSGSGLIGRVCRDDRGINQHFLRPAAISLGGLYEGFRIPCVQAGSSNGTRQARGCEPSAAHGWPLQGRYELTLHPSGYGSAGRSRSGVPGEGKRRRN